jgi:excisionase family DNA binding protein
MQNNPIYLFSTAKLATKLGFPQRTVRYWAASGSIPYTMRSIGGHYLFSEQDLEQIRLKLNGKNGSDSSPNN